MTFEPENDYKGGKDTNSMIIVPTRLIDKIDRNRDQIGRAAFIELCIDSLMEMGGGEIPAPARPARTVRAPQPELDFEAELRSAIHLSRPAEAPRTDGGVTREELNDFKKGIKDLLRAYVEALSPDAASSLRRTDTGSRLDDLLER